MRPNDSPKILRFDPNHNNSQEKPSLAAKAETGSNQNTGRDRRAFLQAAGLATVVGGGAYLLTGDDTKENIAPISTQAPIQTRKFHTPEKIALGPDKFEETKNQAIASADFFNTLSSSNFLDLISRHQRQEVESTLTDLRIKANKAAYFFTLDKEKYLPQEISELKHIRSIVNLESEQAILSPKTYDNSIVRDLIDEHTIGQGIDISFKLEDQMIDKPEQVSREAIVAYAQLQQIMLLESKKDLRENQAVIEFFTLVAKHLEANILTMPNQDIKYFAGLYRNEPSEQVMADTKAKIKFASNRNNLQRSLEIANPSTDRKYY